MLDGWQIRSDGRDLKRYEYVISMISSTLLKAPYVSVHGTMKHETTYLANSSCGMTLKGRRFEWLVDIYDDSVLFCPYFEDQTTKVALDEIQKT
jgi:hypothetical protein